MNALHRHNPPSLIKKSIKTYTKIIYIACLINIYIKLYKALAMEKKNRSKIYCSLCKTIMKKIPILAKNKNEEEILNK